MAAGSTVLPITASVDGMSATGTSSDLVAGMCGTAGADSCRLGRTQIVGNGDPPTTTLQWESVSDILWGVEVRLCTPQRTAHPNIS